MSSTFLYSPSFCEAAEKRMTVEWHGLIHKWHAPSGKYAHVPVRGAPVLLKTIWRTKESDREIGDASGYRWEPDHSDRGGYQWQDVC
jgi:hypothetical protein